MRRQTDTPDWRVAGLAERQYGVVSFRQLRAAGLSGGGIARRVEAGRLHRVHRGVYAVGHPGTALEGRWMAAVLAGRRHTDGAQDRGDPALDDSHSRTALDHWGGALSHRSAAVLWKLLPAASATICVSVCGIEGKDRRSRIHVHRSRTLTAAMVTVHRGIPVTTPERTIADLRRAASTKGCPVAVPSWELRRAIREAEVLGLATGAEQLTERSRSDLELAFLRLVRRHELPEPEINVPIGSLQVDFLWRARRLVVETDGYRYHRGREAFTNDRGRDLKLRRRGYDVMRLSEEQIEELPERVAEVLRGTLEAGFPAGKGVNAWQPGSGQP